MNRLRVIISIFIWTFLLTSFAFASSEPKKTWHETNGNADLKYLVKPPSPYDPGKTYPLLIVLHGMDGKAEEMMRLFEYDKGARGWFIVAPQAKPIARNDRTVVTWDSNFDTKWLMDIIDQLKKDHPIDENKIALAGYSAGAWMSVHMLRKAPTKFYRMALIAGGSLNENSKLPAIDDLSVFLLGAETDGHFDKKQIKSMKKALRKAGAHVEWKVVKDTNHSSICNHFKLVRDWMFHR